VIVGVLVFVAVGVAVGSTPAPSQPAPHVPFC